MRKQIVQFLVRLSIACLVVALPVGTAFGQTPGNKDEQSAKTLPEYQWRESMLKQEPEWYTTAEAREIAGKVLLYQTDAGAWPKNTNLAEEPRSAEYLHKVRTGKEANTIDNKATTTPMRFLALMAQATGEAKYKESFARGLDYLFAAQYANGGWPQYYPLRKGYYSQVTYNDNAMMNVMFLLRDVAEGETPYEFVDAESRAGAAAAVEKGIGCILKTQIKVDGKLTAWCAQYDENTLQPAWARNFEPPSLSGAESVAVVRFLMGIKDPAPEAVAAIEGAIEWFRAVQIKGLRYHRGMAADGQRDGWTEPDPNAEPLWARFYEPGTNRPIFAGRDKEIHYSLDEIERERRGGYSYYGDWPARLLAKDYPEWRTKNKLGRLTAPLDAGKPRVFVLTDIENEPDDAQSMVRFLLYANHYDIEGLVATTSIHQQDKVAPQRIRQITEAYGKVRDRLEEHEPGFPSTEFLLAHISEGLPVYGMEAVGDGKDSPGSELLIRAADSDDPRPLWVTAWGGPNVLAQALWKVRETRSPEELNRFVAKLRVYTISDQDDSGPWIRKEFPGLFYIVSPGFNAGGAYHQATWSGISGDNFHGRFDGADFSLVTNEWLDRNIRSKGPLGTEYPRWEYLMEGDTPSFLNLIGNGLSDPEHPDWGGWGGRYELYTPRPRKWHLQPETRPIWTDAEDEVLGIDGRWHEDNHATIWRWREAYQNDFAARMDWTIKPYAEANHPPVPRLGHAARLSARPGERVELSAEGSSDPDGDALSYHWFYYNEADTFPASSARSGQPVEIRNFDQPTAWFTVPTSRVMPPGTGDMHIILAVTDHGTPRLTRYQRVIVRVEGE